MKVFALSGLTESGKYIAAQYLAQFGVTPHKIDHLLRIVQQKEGSDETFQDWNFRLEAERPHWLFSRLHEEIIASACRSDTTACSIESLYGPILPTYLSQIMGSDFVVVYIDATYEIRLQRQFAHHGVGNLDEARRTLEEKDAFKRSRGNLDVRVLADEILDNSSGLESYYIQLRQMLIRHRVMTMSQLHS